MRLLTTLPAVVVLWGLLGVPLAAAQDPPPGSWSTTFVGVVVPYHKFQGYYERSKTERKGDATYPGSLGIGALVGFSRKVFGFEISYTRSEAEVTFTNPEHKGKASWNQLSFDILMTVIRSAPVRTYLLAGVGLFWLVPENEDLFGQTPLWNGTLNALGANLGGGVEFRPAKTFSIAGELVYRLFDGVNIYNPIGTTRAPITYHMAGHGVNFSASVRVHFN